VLVIGDSFTFGNAVRAEDRFSDLLAARLAARDRVRVINASAGGWDLENYLPFLHEEGLGYDPDILVLALYINDWVTPDRAAMVPVPALTAEGRLDARPQWLRIIPYPLVFALKRSALVTFALGRARVMTTQTDFATRLLLDDVDLAADPTMVTSLRQLERLRAMCDERGIDRMLAAVPPVNLFWIDRGRPRYLAHLAAFAATRRITFVDLSKALWNAGDTNASYLYPWDNHLSPRGRQLVADQLFPVVLRMIREQPTSDTN
jgi:lysophospholipase L1-like esterase